MSEKSIEDQCEQTKRTSDDDCAHEVERVLVRCALLRAQLDELHRRQLLQAILRVGHERLRPQDGALVRHLILRQHLCSARKTDYQIPTTSSLFSPFIRVYKVLYCTFIFDMHSKIEMRRLKNQCCVLNGASVPAEAEASRSKRAECH